MGTIYFFNANLPMTSDNVISTLKGNLPEVVFSVPYTLKLFAESQAGIDILKTAQVVSASGSACPDDIGNKLVANGVNLVTLFGAYVPVARLGFPSAPVLTSLLARKSDKSWFRPVQRPLGTICVSCHRSSLIFAWISYLLMFTT